MNTSQIKELLESDNTKKGELITSYVRDAVDRGETDNVDEVVEVLSKFTQSDRCSERLYFDLSYIAGNLLVVKNEFKHALEYYIKINDSEFADSDLIYAISYCYFKMKEYANSLYFGMMCIKMNPNRWEYFLICGQILIMYNEIDHLFQAKMYLMRSYNLENRKYTELLIEKVDKILNNKSHFHEPKQ